MDEILSVVDPKEFLLSKIVRKSWCQIMGKSVGSLGHEDVGVSAKIRSCHRGRGHATTNDLDMVQGMVV